MRGRLVLLAMVAILSITTETTAQQSATSTASASAQDEHFDILIAAAKAAMMADPKLAIVKADAAYRYADTLSPTPQRALMKVTADWLRGEANIRLNNLAAAQPLIDGALMHVKKLSPGSTLHGNILLSSGGLNTVNAQVAHALADYHAAHAIFRDLSDERSQAKALQSIGMLYGGGNDFATALKYYDDALAVFDADPNMRFSLFNSRGNALKELGRYADGERQYREALSLAEQMKSPLLKVLVLGNLAELRLASGNIIGADQAVAEGFGTAATGEAAFFRKQLYGIAAQAAFQRHDIVKAVALISRRFDGVDFAKTSLLDREAHRTAYRVFNAAGRDDLALRHLVALKRLDDEATKLATNANTALMGARFDFANQELRIVKLKADEAERNVAFERSRAQTQRYVFLGTAGATLVIIAMLLFGIVTIRRSRDKVRAANDDLAVTNAALGKALAAKTEFLATTSHEIRTPLNGILGMTQVMLADASLGAPTRDRLRVVHGAGVTMKALVDDILDVAKMETGNLTIEDAPFDLKATLADSLRLWEDQAHAKGIAFASDLSDCPQMVQGDAARVRQVAFNLLSNAIKFTPAGEIGFRVVVAGDRYRIMVSDSGVGIPADKLDEVFESFRQADTSTTRQFGGTGLGLSICRNLARAMGGTVAVTSIVGRGSTFTVDLPLVRAEVAAVAAVAADAPALLILDRNPITRAMLRTLVAPHVGRVELVGTVDDALAAIERGGVERVLIDDATVRGEGMTIDLARLAGSGVPVAILYANADDDARAMLHDAGVAQVVAKPVTGVALVAALRLVDPPLVSRAA